MFGFGRSMARAVSGPCSRLGTEKVQPHWQPQGSTNRRPFEPALELRSSCTRPSTLPEVGVADAGVAGLDALSKHAMCSRSTPRILLRAVERLRKRTRLMWRTTAKTPGEGSVVRACCRQTAPCTEYLIPASGAGRPFHVEAAVSWKLTQATVWDAFWGLWPRN